MKAQQLVFSLFVGALVFAAEALAVMAAFDAEMYVKYNKTIVEGTIVADHPSEPFGWLASDPEVRFPTNCAAVLVERVLRCELGAVVSVGDTVRFWYPAKNSSSNTDKAGLIIVVSEISHFGSLEVGTHGVFPFTVDDRIGFRPGSWFLTDESQQVEVVELLEALDSEEQD